MKEALRLTLAAFLVTVSGLTGCVAPAPKTEDVAKYEYGPAPTQEQVQAAVKAHLELVLKDAESARYQWVGEPKQHWVKETGFATQKRTLIGWLVVVMVNAKNSYGGYTGFERYQFVIKDGQVLAHKAEKEGFWR